LRADGDARPHVVAYARSHGQQHVIVAALRLVARLGDRWPEWSGRLGGSKVELPGGLSGRTWVNVLTGSLVTEAPGSAPPALAADAVFSECPVAVLVAR
jgi:maltooligosyltrehalose synthase